MELRELRYFLAVAQEQSITRAAEYLYIAQPSLTRQMQNLEREIGRPLFIRGSRKITLTETGLLLKKRAEELLALYERAQAELSAPPEDVCGEVIIGGGESYSVITVAEAARAVQNSYPSVRFEFLSGDAGDILEKLDKGLIDFGIVVDLPDVSKYNSIRLPLADEWGVLMRRDSPLAGKDSIERGDLAAVPLLCSAQSLTKGSRLGEWFGGDIKEQNIAARYNLIYNASLLVKAGMGYAIGLNGLINTTGDSELTFRPLNPPLSTNLDIIWKKYAAFSRPAQIFLDALKREILSRHTEQDIG